MSLSARSRWPPEAKQNFCDSMEARTMLYGHTIIAGFRYSCYKRTIQTESTSSSPTWKVALNTPTRNVEGQDDNASDKTQRRLIFWLWHYCSPKYSFFFFFPPLSSCLNLTWRLNFSSSFWPAPVRPVKGWANGDVSIPLQYISEQLTNLLL